MHLIVMMDGHRFEEPGMTHVVLHATVSDFPFAATQRGGREAYVKTSLLCGTCPCHCGLISLPGDVGPVSVNLFGQSFIIMRHDAAADTSDHTGMMDLTITLSKLH